MRRSLTHFIGTVALVGCSILLVFTPMMVVGQTFHFTPKDLVVTSTPGDRIGCHAEVQNLQDQKLTVLIDRMRNDIPAEWMSSFCLNQCYAPFTDNAVEDVPAKTTLEFVMYFDTGVEEANGEAEIRISSQENPSEQYTLVFKAITKNQTSASELPQPIQYELRQNYPNPFSIGSFGNSSTTIQYAIPRVSNVSLKIYDLLGNEVKTLVNSSQQPGVYSVQWIGKNNNGHEAHSGIYLIKLVSGNFTQTRRMILMK